MIMYESVVHMGMHTHMYGIQKRLHHWEGKCSHVAVEAPKGSECGEG